MSRVVREAMRAGHAAGVRGATWRVLVGIAAHGPQDPAGWCWPSRETLAELADCTVRTVSTALDALETLGLLEVYAVPGRRNRYRLHLSTTQEVLDFPGAPCQEGKSEGTPLDGPTCQEGKSETPPGKSRTSSHPGSPGLPPKDREGQISEGGPLAEAVASIRPGPLRDRFQALALRVVSGG